MPPMRPHHRAHDQVLREGVILLTAVIEGMALWRGRLIAFLSRNASRATAGFDPRSDRVVGIGLEVTL